MIWHTKSDSRAQERHCDWFWALTLLITALGARLWLIHKAGTPLPFWDQWEEARIVYVPFFEGRLSLAELFSAHNEHRMFFNRFYDLAILLLSRQWDNQVEMLANAIVYTVGIIGFGWVVARRIGSKYWPVISFPLLLSLILPFGWENTVGGFHSQVYFGVLFALLTIWLLGCQVPGTLKWWIGVLAAIASLCVPVSGIISSAAIFGLVTLKIFREPPLWRKNWPTLLVCLLLIGAGLKLRVDVPHHRVLMAHSGMQFLISLGQYLAWPWIVVPPFAIFNILPMMFLASFYLIKRKKPMPAEELVLGVGLWAVLQAVATAYARGGQPYPQWRYMDCTCFLMIVNCYSFVLLAKNHLQENQRKLMWKGAYVLWVLATISGLAMLSLRAWQIDIPERQFYFRAQLQNARAYFATEDVRVLDGKPKPELPLYEGDPSLPQPVHQGGKLAQYAASPWVRRILPSCVREPVHMLPQSATGFVTNDLAPVRPRIPGEIFWSSFASKDSGMKRQFESFPLPKTKFPFLEFNVVGDMSKPGRSLSILDLSSGKQTLVVPVATDNNHWVRWRVKAPKGDFKIIARDDDSGAWFAFQAPTEVAWLPWASAKVESMGSWIFSFGAALYLAGLAWTLRAARKDIIPQNT